MPSRLLTAANFLNNKFVLVVILLWSLVIATAPISWALVLDYCGFFLVGITGAIFANTTGAGGGVVFIPLFNQLAFSELQSVATSFAIQCFGMTAGAVTWWRHYRADKTELRLWQGFKRIVAIVSVFSVVSLLAVQQLKLASPSSLHYNFSWFSLVLGAFIFVSVFLIKPARERSQLTVFDWFALSLIGLCGGTITAWLSVGVGELLAIYLILRRFDITMAIAAAVVVSAITVWAAIWQHTLIDFQVYWQVVLFAGPGAILGGILAKTIVSYLSATRIKLFFAFWLLVIGLFGIVG